MGAVAGRSHVELGPQFGYTDNVSVLCARPTLRGALCKEGRETTLQLTMGAHQGWFPSCPPSQGPQLTSLQGPVYQRHVFSQGPKLQARMSGGRLLRGQPCSVLPASGSP